MANYGNNITLNNITLYITKVTPVQSQKRQKQIIGKSLSQVNILGLADQQWELDIKGIVTGTTLDNLSTNRANIEGLDTVTPYTYVDGIHNGTYIVQPGSLDFDDAADKVHTHYTYSITLIQQ